MGARLQFSLLGRLRVDRDGRTLPVPVGRQRALLAALLLNSGRVMATDTLIEILWGDDPPASARASLRNLVGRLRVALQDPDHALISTEPQGYRLSADAGELDVVRFEALVRAGRSAARAGSWEPAAAQARAALELWRGEPLADVTSEVLMRQEIPRLAELRLQALEVRLEADLHLGRQADVIPELRQLVSLHPLREQLPALLMLALYLAGRQAEALAVYRDTRQTLAEELGAEPGAGLRELHQRILNGAPALADADHVPSAAGGPPVAVPRTLPGTVRHFTGRDDELAVLTELVESADEHPGAVVISAIGGTAGVGKTALAVHWAHHVADHFPDGQLYVNLRGYDPGPPMEAGDALAGFLRALGTPGQDIPAGTDERAACYRSLLAGRRMLLVLDNAGSEEQVRPLLPATAGCVALVTSRDSLAGLIAREGARRLELDLLSPADAAGLLRTLIGERAAADPAATRALAARCSRLPLALRVAAERAVTYPKSSLTDLLAELTDEQRRLDLRAVGSDPRTAVRAVFSWSYRHLDASAARAFRLAGLHPGSDFDVPAAAALTGTTAEQARAVLDLLIRAHLVQPGRPGRFSLHDLLRAYARELAGTEDSEETRAAALTCLFDYYLGTAAAAMDILFPADSNRRPRIVLPPAAIPRMDSPATALNWLDTELATLAAIVAHAAANGWPGHATRLAATLFRYLDSGAHYGEAITIHTHARDAARELGDRAAEGKALNHLGVVEARQNRHQQAIGHLRQSIPLSRSAGDLGGEARAVSNLGFIYFQQSQYDQASDHLQRASTLYQTAGNLTGEARVLCNLGLIGIRRGAYEQATGHLQRALVLFGQSGDRRDQALVLANLGEIDLRQGRHEQAIARLQEALAVCRQAGDRQVEADALNGLGEAFLAAGRPADARTHHGEAIGSATQIGNRYEEARAHNGLAASYQDLGDVSSAEDHWQLALALYESLGAPEAGQVRARLADLTDGRGGLPLLR